MLAVYVGAAVASTRGVFAMARDRRLPGALAKVSKRYGTPVAAIVLLMVVQAILIVVCRGERHAPRACRGCPHYFSVFVWCATFGGFALLVVYFLMSIGAFRGVGEDKATAGLIVAALVGIAITAAAIFGSFYKVTSPTLLAPWSAVIWFAIGLVYMALVKGREPASDALADLRT